MKIKDSRNFREKGVFVVSFHSEYLTINTPQYILQIQPKKTNAVVIPCRRPTKTHQQKADKVDLLDFPQQHMLIPAKQVPKPGTKKLKTQQRKAMHVGRVGIVCCKHPDLSTKAVLVVVVVITVVVVIFVA